MKWNWQQADWPQFSYQKSALADLEACFLHQSGVFIGAMKHVSAEDKDTLIVDLMSTEALKTSEIEGEILDRDSLQSSIRRNFGLDDKNQKILPAEQGIAEMMVDLYKTFKKPLSHEQLFAWHKILMKGRRDLREPGAYRTSEDPMQVVSGTVHKPKVHFETPPSKTVRREMTHYIKWLNDTAPGGKNPLPALTRAGIAHLHYVCIHPFEDGNGRIGRAIAEKVLSQCLGQPTLIALSHEIQERKKAYYESLEKNNKGNEITDWLVYFAKTILEAQGYTQKLIDFLIKKSKLYEKLRGKMNARQEKVIARLFREGPEGFKGGLSAEKYISIARTSRATATRDLQELVEIGALLKTGERKYTRYQLCIT